MLLEIPYIATICGCSIGIFLFLVLVYASPFMSKESKRVKPRSEEDSRCTAFHIGLIVAGCVITCTGLFDLWYSTDPDVVRNRLMEAPWFSFVLGSILVSTGGSALFCSYEGKNSIDTKLMSIIWLWLLAFAVWDRARPPLMTVWVMYLCTALSSATMFVFPDMGPFSNFSIILAFIGMCVYLELGSLGFGPVASEQYLLGYAALFLGSVAAFLQCIALDSLSRTQAISAVVCGAVWCVFQGYLQSSWLASVLGLAGLAALVRFPQAAQQTASWSFMAAVSLWWFALRSRPGDPPLHFFDDYEPFAVALLVVFKLNLRRLLAVKSQENIAQGIWMENTFILVEKAVMAAWGYHLLFVLPTEETNYYFDTINCWLLPSIPSDSLGLYYLVNMASCLEDVLWWCTSGASTPRYFSSVAPADYRNGKDRDAFDNKLIGLYHVIMAGLLMGSYYSGKLPAHPPSLPAPLLTLSPSSQNT